MINKKTALRQLKELEKLGKDKRLAADGWNEDWKCLIAILMSARTMDKTTIPIAESLFKKFKTLDELSNADENEIANIINGVNFYLNKAKYIKSLSKKIIKNHNNIVPKVLDDLMDLPGVGRKTANVFLAEKGFNTIGVDTHVDYCSKKLGWSNGKNQKQVEDDLKSIFPEILWGKLNWTLVRFGQTYTNRSEKDEILKRIGKIV